MSRFTDSDDIQAQYADCFSAAEELARWGMPMGYPDGTLRPSEALQGARVVFAMHKILQFSLVGLNRSLASLYKRIARCTVQIDRSTGGLGTGFLISPDGLVATVNHVVDGGGTLVARWAGGPLADLHVQAFLNVVGVDEAHDLALCRISRWGDAPAAFEHLPLGDENTLERSELLVAVGSPIGLGARPAPCFFGGLRDGGMAGPYVDLVGPVNPGNSGGPVVNSAGEVVGLVDWKLVDTAIEGVAGAVPVSYLKELRAALGVQ